MGNDQFRLVVPLKLVIYHHGHQDHAVAIQFQFCGLGGHAHVVDGGAAGEQSERQQSYDCSNTAIETSISCREIHRFRVRSLDGWKNRIICQEIAIFEDWDQGESV